MAITEAFANSQSVTNDEWDLPSDTTTLGSQTTDGAYQCYLDLNALAKGDIFEFRVYEKVGSGSTQRLVYAVRFANAQSSPVWVSPTLILMHGWTMSLNKISGTDRTIDWSIRQIA
jgi:hypothetical protein